MSMLKNKSNHLVNMLVLMSFLLASNSLHSAPGILADKPLMLGSSVQPNILFMVDDSGSMDWEDLLNKGTDFPADSYMGGDGLSNPPSGDRLFLKRRLLCRGYNVMAYDPNVKYTPWSGVDSAGVAYTNMLITAARGNPYNTGTSDISSHIYFTWTDTDGDNEYDGPGSDSGNSSSTSNDECGTVSNNNNGTAVNSLPATGTDANPNSKQNYANWFSYYRKREYVVKRALSEIMDDSKARMGIASLHNHNSIYTQVKDIDDISLPLDTTASANKTALMRNLYRIDSSNGTPLRVGLENVGKYFDNDKATWGSSPILSAADGGECQMNFAVLLSDGYWNGSNPSVSDSDGDGTSNTLADVANYYYQKDLSALANKVPVLPGIDDKETQHLVTYTVAFGVNGTLDSDPSSRDVSFSWPTPVENTNTTIDDMRHAAWNGHGLFLNAGNPAALIKDLNSTIRDIDARSGTSAAVALNTTSFEENSTVYQAEFDSAGWHGQLVAREITTTGITSTPIKWDAGDKLNKIVDLSTRKIYTHNGTNGTSFAWSNLVTAQKNDLLVNKGSEDADVFGGKIVSYLYGDHSNEGTAAGQFRARQNNRLGDIIHSAPTFVGAPRMPYPDTIESTTNLYSTFVTAKEDRTEMVYVGANDGMLHAFDNSTGNEKFAYIPSMLFSTASGEGLHSLAQRNYSHRYYVDLSPKVQDVVVGGNWATYLVGGLRGGGKGIFALDITDPNSFTASDIKWEFTHNDLGYTFSEIAMAKMNNGKWAAIFGNGYNNGATGDGKAKLFIVYLNYDGTASSYKLLDTGVGSVSSASCANMASDCNGLSSPELADLNADGTVDRIYAGDLFGNLWAFDVSNVADSEWDVAYYDTTVLTKALPLASACRSAASTCLAADRQPITSKPTVAWHPTESTIATSPNVMVMFGTGQYLTDADKLTQSIQSLYGVWDSGKDSLHRGNLQSQVITEGVLSSNAVRILSNETVNYGDLTSPQYGWYIDLKDVSSHTTSKERITVNPVVYGDIVFFNTMKPVTDGVCTDLDNDKGWMMAASLLHGGRPGYVVTDVNDDGLYSVDDTLGGVPVSGVQPEGIPTESKFIGNKRITAMSNGKVHYDQVRGMPTDTSRMSWTNF